MVFSTSFGLNASNRRSSVAIPVVSHVIIDGFVRDAVWIFLDRRRRIWYRGKWFDRLTIEPFDPVPKYFGIGKLVEGWSSLVERRWHQSPSPKHLSPAVSAKAALAASVGKQLCRVGDYGLRGGESQR